ncbi:MAG: PQQ-dependent sugar dehydrogenase [Zoogloeaceae bacterium]|jgi:glucose/arabinose dehydrogenase|nr:PQQ-dependent sugar dehydrogenase [Zoogloeaceae bacterium]
MKQTIFRILLPFTLAFASVLPTWAQSSQNRLPLEQIQLPPGFRISLWARVESARGMTQGSGRTVFVGSMRTGNVTAIEYDADYRATRTHTIARNLTMPAGVAFRDGNLYVSSHHRIVRLDQIESRLDNPLAPVVVRDDFPTDRSHSWKFIAFGPDGKLYVPVGAPCNICEPDANRYANIMRMNPDGSGLETFARGVRNSVGFDWNPKTKELWFTDNGRDWLGDDVPPCELNRAPRPGMHFGYPYCHGRAISDPEFGKKHACAEFTPPVQELGAHVAAIGMRFYRPPTQARRAVAFPPEYHGHVFIAEHGSWNRSEKSGYRVTLVKLNGNRAISYTPFATGWLQGQSAWGRPADVEELPDGSLLVSDDYAGAIYRITYEGGTKKS